MDIPDMDVIARAKGGTVVFEGKLSEFPPEIIARAAAYAIHKKVQDATGGTDMTDTEILEAAAKVIEQFKAGTWATRGGGGPRADAFQIWLNNQALAAARDAKKTNPKMKSMKLPDIAELAKANPAWVEKMRAEYDRIPSITF